ncbi:hypothetical protein K1719_030631 [Acacia pycnantha]|nr:hypothetical protein K1719_030631 [Acacia pycnantha]
MKDQKAMALYSCSSPFLWHQFTVARKDKFSTSSWPRVSVPCQRIPSYYNQHIPQYAFPYPPCTLVPRYPPTQEIYAMVLNPNDGIRIDVSNPLCPSFYFEEKEKDRLMKPFGRTLVVKLLGRHPSYEFMVKKLRQIWEQKGRIDIFDLQNNFYLVSFQHSEDYMEALTGGPWVINDAYLNVSRWRVDFDPKNERITSVVAWVRFPDLSAPLFDKKFLLNLGNVIGKAIKLDIHTAQRARGKFARMCVELDLTKPLVPEFEKKRSEAKMDVEEAEKTIRVGEVVEEKKERWQTVQRTRRQRNYNMPTKVLQSGSRFSTLEREVGDEVRVSRTEEAYENRPSTGVQDRGLGMASVREQKRQGKKTYMGEENQCHGVLKSKEVGGEGNVERKGIKGRVGKVIVENKAWGEFPICKNSQGSQGSMECDTETNTDRYRYKGVNYCDKENLKPGETTVGLGSKDDMVMDQGRHGNEHEELIACTSKSGVQQFSTPRLADDIKGVAAVVRDMKKRYKLDLVVILEPRINGSHASKLYVQVLLNIGGEEYGICYKKISRDTVEPWLIARDFNEIKSPLEQKGGGRINEARCRNFNEWIQNCKLLDIEPCGPFFTWKGPKWEGLDQVYKRLDRCLCNTQWQEKFSRADVRVIPRIGLDHHPLVVRLEEEVKGVQVRPFKFQAAWLMHEQFEGVLARSWNEAEQAHRNLFYLQQELYRWNREVFGNIEARKKRLLSRLNGVQRSNDWRDTEVGYGVAMHGYSRCIPCPSEKDLDKGLLERF